jgi:exonuclease III
MKVLSYNVMGLGGGEKRVEVRRLVQEKQPFVLCIQESKLMTVSDRLVEAVCGGLPLTDFLLNRRPGPQVA